MRPSRNVQLFLAGLISILTILTLLAHGAEGSISSTVKPSWTSPTSKSLKRISDIPSAQTEPNLFSNFDCILLTYRVPSDTTMQTGCFVETAFGMLDPDTDIVIYNGTDEGLPLLPYSSNEVLVPWSEALNVLSLNASNTGGSYVRMYNNPLLNLAESKNLFGTLTSKQFTTPAQTILRDTTGKPLIVNPQTVAISSGGSWLVAETLSGAFVRINLATLDAKDFARAYGTTGSPGLLKSQVAVESSGTFAAIENNVAQEFKIYDVSNCQVDLPLCTNYDFMPFIKQQIPSLKTVRHVRFINEGLILFEVVAQNSLESGTYVLAPNDSIGSLIDYLGTGDSYTSGEGAFDYRAGTDTAENVCHLSTRSYPELLARDLYSAAGGHSVACSGATIQDVTTSDSGYRGQSRAGPSFEELVSSQTMLLDSVTTNYMPGYIAQYRFAKTYQPRVITVSVGGDDIGFGTIVRTCAEPHASLHAGANTCFANYEDRKELKDLIDRTTPRWISAFKKLQASAPEATIYAIGYPQIAVDNGNCGINVRLNTAELEFAHEIIDYLNGVIEDAAAASTVRYIDISDALTGHRLCEASGSAIAMNGLTAGNDGGILGTKIIGRESFHPNALGHELIEQAILKKSHNLASNPARKANRIQSTLLDAPHTGRSTYSLSYSSFTDTNTLNKGSPQALIIDRIGLGLAFHSSVEIHIDGPSGPIVGTASNSLGPTISGSLLIPTTVPSGSHTIDVIGVNQSGKPVDSRQPILVFDSSDDSDGDGIKNLNDSCPYYVNSGVDADRDAVDDICDSQIVVPTITTSPSAPSGPSKTLVQHPQNIVTFTSSIGIQPAAILGSSNATQQLRDTPLGTKTGISPKSAQSTHSTIPTILGVKNIQKPLYTKQNLVHIDRLPNLNWRLWIVIMYISLLILLVIAHTIYRRIWPAKCSTGS